MDLIRVLNLELERVEKIILPKEEIRYIIERVAMLENLENHTLEKLDDKHKFL